MIVGHGVGIRFNVGFGYTYSHKMSVSILVKTFKTMGIWNVVDFKMSTLRLYTRAKSRYHEIVRAQKKVSEGRPNTPATSCSSVLMDLQV
jgi:hypothetical protein